MKRVLCHGDLWSTNLIWRKGENCMQLASVIDFQTAHFGCPTTDIARLLNACLSAKDRRESWEVLLEKFYSYLSEEIGGGEIPYTLDQLKQGYRLYFPFSACMIVSVIAPLFELANSSDDNGYRERVQELVLEKTKGLLEDTLKFHEENKEKMRKKYILERTHPVYTRFGPL
ncbi:hypothetical protein ANCCEY_12690 [Ancylostoma ceylanicum]|uniref:CHK kinase-like domain-containing protein n=2 Tax=Ancylostoma ceylanicum TaxID=53326 RepID=A0A0D6L8P4_9BILA|nr:hypothetical protein ANCCEY_12690 [Ancylostoma ceylanicum]EYB95394.1 hypothetical protein Y032_0160g3332 [Ancylostoma ceylanicum]